jgi:hypothetical protein
MAPAVPFVIVIFDGKLGRDMFTTGALFYLAILCQALPTVWRSISWSGAPLVFHALGLVDIGVAVALTIRTRRLYSEWGAVLGCIALFCLGCCMYFYLPLTSMANPPINWGYPRTPGGFFHVITRGQYDRFAMTHDLKTFLGQVWLYASDASRDFGWPCLAVAVAPFCLWRQLGGSVRKSIAGMAILYVFLTFLMLAVLDPTPERQTGDLVKMYFSISYVVLAVWMGFGLILLGRLFLLANSTGITGIKQNLQPAP